MKEEKLRYEPLPKPEIENVKEVIPDTEEFNEPDKAKALIKNLTLSVGDTIQEDDEGEYYTINPRQVLDGHSPDDYKKEMRHTKALLTILDIKKITIAIKRRTKDYDKKLYNYITKKTDKFFKKNYKPKNETEKQAIEYFKQDSKIVVSGFNNTIYHLLSKDKEDYLICYRCAWFNKPIPDQRVWSKRDDGEYRVLTDSEADQAFDDYFDDDELWKMAVEAGNTTSSRDDWIDEVKNSDGRGSSLSGYDGCENEETINEVTYFIYRTN